MKLTEKDYAHWLFNVEKIGNATIDKLLCGGLTCKDVYEMNSKELRKSLRPELVKNIEISRSSWDFDLQSRRLSELGIRFISRIEKDFPDKLKNIPNAPFAIYVKGRLPNPKLPTVSIIGARMCSDYGRFMARNFGRGLALSKVQIISGMAKGIDAVAQKAALEAGGDSFGVLGCGVDICYPEENRGVYEGLCSGGGLISEYPPGTKPTAQLFPPRNRIISALSDVVLVVEARKKSGTQITVDTALEQGREVLAVPGRVTDRLSDGCNYLIGQGAGIAMDVEDVLDRIWTYYDKPTFDHRQTDNDDMDEKVETEEDPEFLEEDDEREITLEEEIMGIVDVIPVSGSYILEELYKKGRNLSVPQLMVTLMDMIGDGKIIQEGTYYRRNQKIRAV